MNILEACPITSPYDNDDTCAKFTIDVLEDMFTMHDITSIDHEYTLSLWLKADIEGAMTVLGNDITVTSEWTYYVITFTAESVNISLKFNVAGTYYIYHPQLEMGNKATNWRPAPEDMEQSMADTADDIYNDMAEKNMAITEEYNAAIDNALEGYVEDDEFGGYKESMSGTIDGVKGELSDRIDNISTDFNNWTTNFGEYIHIDDINGTIAFHSKETNRGMFLTKEGQIIICKDVTNFNINNKENILGYWDGDDFLSGNIVVEVKERAQFGNFAFIPRSDGSLSFLKVGDT